MRPFFVLLAVLAAGPLTAQVKTSDPGFPDRETLVYTETLGNQTRAYQTSLVRTGTGADERIEFRSVGADLEALYRLDPATLVSLSSESTTKAADAVVKRSAEYRNLKPHPAADELAVTDLGSLPAVLRGYPFDRKAVTKIAYIGNTSYGGGGISFELQVVGRETVQAAGRSWECYKMTSGLGGALSVLLAKTEYWFAVEGSHPLIKASGPSGGPGSPTRVLLLKSFG